MILEEKLRCQILREQGVAIAVIARQLGGQGKFLHACFSLSFCRAIVVKLATTISCCWVCLAFLLLCFLLFMSLFVVDLLCMTH